MARERTSSAGPDAGGVRLALGLGLLLAAAAWAGVLAFVRADRQEVVAQVQGENAFIASAFEEHARRILHTADTALRFLARRMEEGGAVTDELRTFAAMTREDLSAAQVAIADERGELVYSAVPLPGAVNVADREHFQVHRRAADAGLYVGRPVRAKVSGDWAFFLSRRITRRDGSFGGVVTLGLDPRYFGKVYSTTRIGHDRAGLLVGTDHVVRVRLERNRDDVGDDIGGYSPVFREAEARPVGAYEVEVQQGHVRRLASYRVMPDYPLIVIASALEEEVLAGWSQRRRLLLAAAALFTALVGVACWLIVRSRAEAARRRAEAEALQAQLLQAQKLEAIGSLAGGVAHDFNNMLGVILGSAELALAEAPPEGLLRECLQEIREAATRSAGVTRQLLTFARRAPVAPREVDVNRQVGDLLQVLRRLLSARVELRWRPGEAIWPVRLDPGQLDQAITNLVTNARDAMDDAGVLTIETANRRVDAAEAARHPGRAPGDYVVVAVTDTGRGIDPAHRDAIFEPFFTTKERGRGTGLGLATVLGVAEQGGGFVDVESEPGKGASFRVHLPRAAVAAPARAAAAAGAPATLRGTDRILVVEDERAHLQLVRRMLEAAGYRVLGAGDPLEALRLAEAAPDGLALVLTDVVMPHMDGRQLVDALRARRPGLRAVFMSGYPASAFGAGAGPALGQAYLQKPFEMGELCRVVRQALDA